MRLVISSTDACGDLRTLCAVHDATCSFSLSTQRCQPRTKHWVVQPHLAISQERHLA